MEKKRIMLPIPTTKNFLQKKTNDLLFGYLMINSFYDQSINMRYLYKENIKYEEIVEQLDSINTKKKVQRDMSFLKQEEFIDRHWIDDKFGKNKEIIEILTGNINFFISIPKETIEYMVNALSKDSIKIYAYLYSKQEYSLKKNDYNYVFSINEIISDCLQLKTTSSSSCRRKINDILNSLQLHNLIQLKTIHRYVKKDNNNYSYEMKEIIYIGKEPKRV